MPRTSDYIYEATVTEPDLNGRVARCTCGKERPSERGLAFFTYTGPGSFEAVNRCAVCGFYRSAHEVVEDRVAKAPSPLCAGHAWVPEGGRPTDRFYCGCAGWD